MTGNVPTADGALVRPMKSEDAPAIAKIWADGLSQTAEAAPFLIRKIVAMKMEELRQQALSSEGDVGPEGCKLEDHWQKEGRAMLVACLEERPNEVVGCVGVQLGYDFHQTIDLESKVGSIWRMSVDDSAQRRGLGKKLMTQAERWANDHGCTSMKLYTGNSIAASFYCNKMGYALEPLDWYPWVRWMLGVPYPYLYGKAL